jgi:nucleotide-binding universal stress UspA family protein
MAERHDADLIVVGGEPAPDTVHGAPCAVAVAPRGYATRDAALRTVGVGCDSSAESLGALALARRSRTVRQRAAGLHGGGAAAADVAGDAAEPVQPEVDAAARQRERARLGAALDGIGEREVGYPVVGDPATELTRRSGHLDLLVLGSRSHGPLRRLILGSTSRHLVRHAACPVLVLPRGARAPAALDTAVAQ